MTIPLTKEAIVALLNESDKAVGRALVALYRRQIEEERRSRATLVRNGLGFNAADAHAGSFDAYDFIERGALGFQQLEFWRTNNRIQKYAGQLLEIAQQRVAAKMLEDLAR